MGRTKTSSSSRLVGVGDVCKESVAFLHEIVDLLTQLSTIRTTADFLHKTALRGVKNHTQREMIIMKMTKRNKSKCGRLKG
jgi:hypothetical protein